VQVFSCIFSPLASFFLHLWYSCFFSTLCSITKFGRAQKHMFEPVVFFSRLSIHLSRCNLLIHPSDSFQWNDVKILFLGSPRNQWQFLAHFFGPLIFLAK
jgi:hypothetical protein